MACCAQIFLLKRSLQALWLPISVAKHHLHSSDKHLWKWKLRKLTTTFFFLDPCSCFQWIISRLISISLYHYIQDYIYLGGVFFILSQDSRKIQIVDWGIYLQGTSISAVGSSRPQIYKLSRVWFGENLEGRILNNSRAPFFWQGL